MPEHFCGGRKYPIPITEKIIGHINHWSNLWSLNVILALSNIARIKESSIIEKMKLAFKARSLNQWRILHKANTIGNNCDIHPTAYVEGSVIGDNVQIGAGVVVRSSIIGDGVNLGTGVIIEASVIGENSTMLHGHIMFSVIYPRLFSVAQMISASIIGRNAFIGSGVTLTDYRLDGKNIDVIQDEKRTDTGSKLLGVCLGNDVYLGSGCIISPGREIPNGMRVVPDRERVLETPNDPQGFRIVE